MHSLIVIFSYGNKVLILSIGVLPACWGMLYHMLNDQLSLHCQGITQICQLSPWQLGYDPPNRSDSLNHTSYIKGRLLYTIIHPKHTYFRPIMD